MKRLKIVLSDHARYQIKDRKLSVIKVRQVLAYSDKTRRQEDGRLLAYKLFKQSGKNYLLIVIYEQTNSSIEIVTAFITSKLHKYL